MLPHMRSEGTGLWNATISQWGSDSGLDSLGLDGWAQEPASSAGV